VKRSLNGCCNKCTNYYCNWCLGKMSPKWLIMCQAGYESLLTQSWFWIFESIFVLVLKVRVLAFVLKYWVWNPSLRYLLLGVCRFLGSVSVPSLKPSVVTCTDFFRLYFVFFVTQCINETVIDEEIWTENLLLGHCVSTYQGMTGGILNVVITQKEQRHGWIE